MRAISFLDGWTCRHLEEDGPGVPVRIPHDAMLAEPKSETAPGGTNTGWYEGFDYLYRKVFRPEADWQGQHLVLEFEGVYHNAEVWLNGRKRAFRPYGYTNFYVDLTGLLDFAGENTLEVIARNADQPNSRWYSGAGIYRPVTLWVGGAEHIPCNGVRVRTLDIQPARVEVTAAVSAPGEVQIEILDGEKVLARKVCRAEGAENPAVTAGFTLPEAKLWSPETPQLYTCRVRFGQDEAAETFGIRTLSWGRQGICINGKRVILQGACIHHDNGLLGAVCDPDAVERKVRLLMQAGYNAIRSAHNPCSKTLLEVCDRLGVLVMDEYIDHWYIHKTQYDYVDYFMDWWKQDLKDMVDKDYNHPCVILYSTGNEVSETAQPRGIALTEEMTQYLHRLDSTRPVTCGVNIFFNFLSSLGFGVYSDEKAKKQLEQAEKARAAGAKPQKDKAVGSQFFNNLAGLLGDEFMKRGATLHGCDVRTRDAFAKMDIAGYNYGIYRYRRDLKKYPDRLILGSETFCNDAYRFREMAKQDSRIVGDFVWAGMDYLGEVMVGSWEYSDYAPRFDGGLGWVSAGSGRIDLTGKLLCEALYTRVALEKETGPYIGVCPVNHTGEKHSPSAWKMSHALESWSWPGCEGKKAKIEVYARAARVALLLNGKKVGEKSLKKDCILRFSCTYQPGVLEAVAYDAAGREIRRRRLVSAAKETCLTAQPEQSTVAPGRLAYVRLRYTDPAGITKPTERGPVRVKVTGGELLALGNGCPFNLEGYLSDTTDTYFGEALAIVRAGEKGEVCLTADGRGLTETVHIPIRKEA